MPTQHSIGYMAQHLEDANLQLCSLFGATEHVRTAKDSLADTVKARWPIDTLIARLRASLVCCDNAIGRLTDASLADTLQASPPGATQPVLRARYLILLVTAVSTAGEVRQETGHRSSVPCRAAIHSYR